MKYHVFHQSTSTFRVQIQIPFIIIRTGVPTVADCFVTWWTLEGEGCMSWSSVYQITVHQINYDVSFYQSLLQKETEVPVVDKPARQDLHGAC